MKKNVLITALLATPVVLTGCMRPVAKTNMQPEPAMVAVRFVVPSETDTWASTQPNAGDENTQLVVDRTYEGHAGMSHNDVNAAAPSGRHVALWGGPYEASDVTYHLAALTPGSYTFAFVDPGQSDMIQGWIDVNNIGHDIVQMLRGWKNDIPEQKRMLAYHYETSGRMNSSPTEAFEDFSEQLNAFNKLERQIDRTIGHETQVMADRSRRISTFLRSAELLVMPGDDTVFHPTTQAMFTSDDLNGARGGHAQSKIVVVADQMDVKRKQDVVNDLFSGFSRYRSVLEQAVTRMERRKGLMLLTDHLRNNDKRFVDTEMRLQFTLGEIDRVNERMADLRDRRMALAFISGLINPDGQFAAMTREEQDLHREMTILETEMNQANAVFDETEPNSGQRVAIERNRQRIASTMEVIEQQFANISEAKTALETMAANTNVIHRQGDHQLLTTTYVGQQLPYRVRSAVEREALMTVRIEATDRVFVPNQGTVASSNSTYDGDTTGSGETYEHYGHQGQTTAANSTGWESNTTTASFHDDGTQFDHTDQGTVSGSDSSNHSGNVSDYHHHHNHPNYAGHPGQWQQNGEGTGRKVMYGNDNTTGSHGRVHYGSFVGHKDSPQNQKPDDEFCDCPLFVRILFPQTWFKHKHAKH